MLYGFSYLQSGCCETSHICMMFKSIFASVGAVSHLLPRQLTQTGAPLPNVLCAVCAKPFSLVSALKVNPLDAHRPPSSSVPEHLLQPMSCLLLPTQSYKVKTSLYKRCRHCYFVRRQGRLFVECKAKGRHKQMQKMSKRKLFRE